MLVGEVRCATIGASGPPGSCPAAASGRRRSTKVSKKRQVRARDPRAAVRRSPVAEPALARAAAGRLSQQRDQRRAEPEQPDGSARRQRRRARQRDQRQPTAPRSATPRPHLAHADRDRPGRARAALGRRPRSPTRAACRWVTHEAHERAADRVGHRQAWSARNVSREPRACAAASRAGRARSRAGSCVSAAGAARSSAVSDARRQIGSATVASTSSVQPSDRPGSTVQPATSSSERAPARSRLRRRLSRIFQRPMSGRRFALRPRARRHAREQPRQDLPVAADPAVLAARRGASTLDGIVVDAARRR